MVVGMSCLGALGGNIITHFIIYCKHIFIIKLGSVCRLKTKPRGIFMKVIKEIYIFIIFAFNMIKKGVNTQNILTNNKIYILWEGYVS